MKFERNESILFSDTLIPDVFISEYLPILTPEQVKIYVYIAYLSSKRIKIEQADLRVKLGLEIEKINEAILGMEALGLLIHKSSTVTISDIKDKELHKLFKPKLTSTAEEAAKNMARNKERMQVVKVINNRFFQGIMPPSWFTDLDNWFDRFGFAEDVMLALFQHCFDHNAINKNYMLKVAQSWHSKGIRNSFDLDKYFMEYAKVKDVRSKITKSMRLPIPNEYEDQYIRKWVEEYQYSFEIIELALRKTTRRFNVGFDYIDAIITEWYINGLKTVDQVVEYEKNIRKTPKSDKRQKASETESSLDKRGYDEKYMKDLFE